ncbi:uncharacterized protein LOC109075019 isoform X2 [Cyprinus carpio]|uniref:Uncharacterized protein LOC109075019 isoform X2 n=1 Tax=Cyprinus carpio TaxID=7962 RepID=A0A9Q9XC29_CYPCA|nr:uncharacterized protein LOC109075019 isoform X2 [Cyprinus carpio]
MEYKLYLQSKSTIPSSTKRRWSNCHKDYRKEQYKAWLQDPVRQDDTSNTEDENSSSCYKTETAHHTSDDTSNSEDENSSPCYETDTESYHTTVGCYYNISVIPTNVGYPLTGLSMALTARRIHLTVKKRIGTNSAQHKTILCRENLTVKMDHKTGI